MDAPQPAAWQRAGLQVDDGPVAEDQHIVWLQVGEHYADSRGFAGTTSYDGSRVRWDHAVGTPGDDAGVLSADGDGLLEDGVLADGRRYREVWVPLPGADGPCGAWRAGDAMVVRVGEHVVHVDGAGGFHVRATALMPRRHTGDRA